MALSPLVPVVFVGYIIVVLAIGLYAGKGLSRFTDFSVMDRNAIRPLVIATISGTIIGAGATLGTSGTANSGGLTAIITLAIPWTLTLAVTTYLGNPLWEIGKKTDAQSLGDAFGYYYGTPSQLTVGLLGLIMTVPVLGAQMVAAGRVFSTVLPVNFTIAVLVAGGILVAYSAYAGIRGVIITDWVQFAVLMLIIPATALFLVVTVGFEPAIQEASPTQLSLQGDRTLFNLVSFAFLIFGSETLAPYYIGRLYAGDKKPGRRGYLASLTSGTYMLCAIAIGFIGIAVLPSVSGESIIPEMLVQTLPPWLGAVGAAALFAVLISSSDSILNAVSVIMVRDFYNVFNPSNDRQQLVTGRILTIVVGILSVGFALAIPDIVGLLSLGYFYWAPTVLVITGAMLLTKRRNLTPYTPPVAMLGTAVFITIWFVAGKPYGLNPFFPGLLVNVVLLVGYHYLSKSVDSIPSGEDQIGKAGSDVPAKGAEHISG